MSEMKLTYGGPAIHKIEKYNPTEVIVRLEREHPRATRDQIEKLFLAEIEDDKDYRTPALRYFFWNAWMGLHPESRSSPRSKQPQQLAAKTRQLADTYVEKIKQNIIIGELMTPLNKKLADCTGTELIKVGGVYTRIGEIVKRRKVGAVLTEDQLWKLWKESK